MIYIEDPVLIAGRGEEKKINTVKVGDMTIDMNGNPTEITAVSEIIEREVFRITCEDGSWVRSCEEQQWRIKKVIDAKAHLGMNIGSIRGIFERAPLYLAKFMELRPVKIEKVESIGVKPCISITVAAADGIYVTRKAIIVRGGEP